MDYSFEEGKDYSFQESNEAEFYAIKLLTGKWKNVLYIYGTVSIKESPELDQATLGFTYNIQEPGSYEDDELINDPEFKDYIGALLQHIITDSMDYADENNIARIGIGHNESNTNTHTESST